MGEETKAEEQVPAAVQSPAETKPEKLAEDNKEAPVRLPPAEDERPLPAEEEKKEEEPLQPPPPIVIYVDLHCVGCAKKIERSILKIKGVEEVVIDMAQNQVTIQGVVEPQAICNKIMKKTKRKAKVLSTLPATANESKPLPEVVASPASQVSGLNTVELKVNMHCEACAGQLKKRILKMKGVQTAETELSSGKVTVTGPMDSNTLVEYVYKRTKKTAKIVPQPEWEKPAEEPKPVEEPKPEEKQEENNAGPSKEEGANIPAGEGEVTTEVINPINHEEESIKRMMYQYNYYHYRQPMYVVERMPPPLLFSDENPNACCIS